MDALKTFIEKTNDKSYKDGELIELAKEMIGDLETKAERYKTIAYNAINLGQLDEQYSYSELLNELGISDSEYDEISDGDSFMEQKAKDERLSLDELANEYARNQKKELDELARREHITVHFSESDISNAVKYGYERR